MTLGKLGEQIVLKSRRAFDAITPVRAIPADRSEYYTRYCNRDSRARIRLMGKVFPTNDGTYSVSPEYWAGWVLAYYQWESGKSFRFLQNNGLDIKKVIALYHPLHEADIDKFADTADAIILNHIETSASPVKKARERIGITQKELSERSDVSLRMIRAYEQKKQPLSNASFSTVSSIASILHIEANDLML